MKSQTIATSKVTEEEGLHWGWCFLLMVLGLVSIFAFFAVPAVMGWNVVSAIQITGVVGLFLYGAAH